MNDPNISRDPDALELQLALEVAKTVQDDFSREVFLDAVLPELLRLIGAEAGGLVVQSSGHWAREVWVGEESRLPELLIGEAMDKGNTQLSDAWCVTPLRRISVDSGDAVSELTSALILQITQAERAALEDSPDRFGRLQRAAVMIGGALWRIEWRDRQAKRIEQLSAVLQAAAQWQRLEEDETLLHGIADTATQLLNCERASIFLWDKRRKKLIGRPALGVEGGVLEVDDDAGVVGEVLRSGESRIWNVGSDDESRVNRKVDRSLEFQTRSLVAVPMEGQRSDLIGVFEAINHLGDGFDASDAVVLADLATHAAVAIQSLRARRKLTETRDRLVKDAASAASLIGEHPAVESVRRNADKVAKTELNVLVLGKNGTGKEVLARHIHFESDRRSGPFIAVNCAALVESLLESELFGHEKGAFTDANQTRPGKFELANGGTLFLDEVGDMSLGGQAKLLRVLEDRVVIRVGGSQTIPVDVRVIAATNQPLEQMIQEKRFREDLFFRLNVVSLSLPTLAERGDDVLLLAEHFLEQFSYQIGRTVPHLHATAKDALRSHPWPGNIRELRNTIERVAYLCSDDEIQAEDLMLSGTLRAGSDRWLSITGALPDATRDFQIGYIERAIETCGGNMTEAAARLGLHRSNLYRKMRQLGMSNTEE